MRAKSNRQEKTSMSAILTSMPSSKGQTIYDVLKSAFSGLFLLEEKMNLICDNMGDATPEELDAMMTELGEIAGYLRLP